MGSLSHFFRSLRGVRRDKTHAQLALRRCRPTLETLEDRLQPSAGALTLGAAAEFGILGINGGDVTLHGATVVGNVGLGAHESSSLEKTTDTGTLLVDPTAKTKLSQVPKSFKATGGEQTQDLSQAVSDADSASAAFAALPATQTFGHLTHSLTITGNGGTNVIDVKSLAFVNKTLTLSGSSSDVFIINVQHGFSFTRSKIELTGGVTANQVVFNFSTGRSAITLSGKSVINGTFLAPHREVDYQGNAVFNGAIIAKSIDLESAADLTFAGFVPPPQPGSLSGSVVNQSNGNAPISGVTIDLTGTTNAGQSVSLSATTDGNGDYSFAGLLPGTYVLTEEPSNLMDNANTPGTLGGYQYGTSIVNIVVTSGANGTGYVFGDIQQIIGIG